MVICKPTQLQSKSLRPVSIESCSTPQTQHWGSINKLAQKENQKNSTFFWTSDKPECLCPCTVHQAATPSTQQQLHMHCIIRETPALSRPQTQQLFMQPTSSVELLLSFANTNYLADSSSPPPTWRSLAQISMVGAPGRKVHQCCVDGEMINMRVRGRQWGLQFVLIYYSSLSFVCLGNWFVGMWSSTKVQIQTSGWFR